MTQSESQRVDIARTTPETSDKVERLSVQEQRIPPRRGLVPLHNQSGKPLPVTDVRRLIRLNRAVFKTEKIDLLAHGPIPNRWRGVFDDEDALDAGLDVRLSWRTDCSAPPDSLGDLRDAGLFDVFLTPRSLGAGLDAWLAACLELRAPVRVQVQPPFAEDLDAARFAERLAKYEVRVLNVTLNDPFLPHSHSARSGESQRTLSQMNALVKAANARDIEANLIGTPLCLVDEQNLPCAQNDPQFFLDHQQYRRESYEFARQVYPLPPFITSAVIALTLGRHTYRETNIDNRLLGWLIQKHPVWHACAASFHKATRALRIGNKPAKPIADTQEAYDEAIKALDREETARLGTECSRCSLRRICDHETPGFKRALPGIPVKAVTGELCVSPMHFAKSQRKYYDALDESRRRISETQKALAKQANVAINSPPDLQFGFDHYGVENGYYMQLPGAITWFSITKEEKRSTLLASLQAPFTVAVTFGGGIADYIGFSLGRHAKILCPMEAYSHRLALHVDASGNFVLLRDGALMRPVEFDGAQYAPAKAPTVAPLRLSAWNIDRSLSTQNLLVWQGGAEPRPRLTPIAYSVVIVSTRFTRRLQAVLRCIAHQRGFDFGKLEVIVAYVPGIDATDDLLSSVELAYPHLRIVRSPFPERHSNSKGFIINESMELASGAWIVLLDSDILLPPDLFAQLEKVPDSVPFVAPDRRKMLPGDVSAKILLGDISPWDCWDELLAGPGDVRVREGIQLPIGFFQCVRAEIAKKVKYTEFGHFEGADWDFILGVEKSGGAGMWLEGAVVLHLDHGGSQWYGAHRHM